MRLEHCIRKYSRNHHKLHQNLFQKPSYVLTVCCTEICFNSLFVYIYKLLFVERLFCQLLKKLFTILFHNPCSIWAWFVAAPGPGSDASCQVSDFGCLGLDLPAWPQSPRLGCQPNTPYLLKQIQMVPQITNIISLLLLVPYICIFVVHLFSFFKLANLWPNILESEHQDIQNSESWIHDYALTIHVIKFNFKLNFMSQGVVKLQILNNNQSHILKKDM